MPQNYKVLGQSNPSSATATALYTVPASTQSVCSTLTICNLASTATTFRLAVRVNGAALANAQYVAYDVPLAGADSISLTLGLALSAGDIVTVYAGSANVAFSLFGVEIT